MKKKYRIRSRQLGAAELRIDHRYQAPLIKSKAKRIALAFDVNKFGSLHISERDDGSRWIIDGQHRHEALRTLGRLAENVPCQVYYGLTLEEEAALFEGLNDSRRPTALARFNALLCAKAERESEIVRIIGEFGFKVSPNSWSGSDLDSLRCVTYLTRIYERMGGEGLSKIMLILSRGWPEKKNPRGDTILALGLITEKLDGSVDYSRIEDVLRKRADEDTLLRKGRAMQGAMGGSLAVNIAESIIVFYNMKLTEPKKLPMLRRR